MEKLKKGSRPRYRGKRKKPKNKAKIPTQEIQIIDPRCSKPHRLIVTDKETGVQFLLASDAQLNLFPKSLIEESSHDTNRIEPSHILVDSLGRIIYTFGQVTLKIDLGLGKVFSSKFTLVDFDRPIIGRDFLSHFNLQINFQKMCLVNLETGLETTRISTVACECHRNDDCDDGWPNITAIFKRSIKHRNHIMDQNTRKAFLVGFSSQSSVFPKSQVKEEDLEPFNNSFELHWISGKVAQVLGWTTQKLNFGLGREFTWKFAVIDIDKPIIGLDFIKHFGLTQQLKMGYFSLFDSETKLATPAPSGPCDCGNFREGWPKSCFLITKYLKNNPGPTRKSHSKNLKDTNSESPNRTLNSFSQNSTRLQVPKQKSEEVNRSAELSKSKLKPLSLKSRELDQYPEPFTQNPKTFDQIYKELERLNQNPESSKPNAEPSNQNSKEFNQYPQPFIQNLKPFSQSSRELQLTKKIPVPFKPNPELFKKNPKESIENSEQPKRSSELSNQNSAATQQDHLETFSEKSREENPKPKQISSRRSDLNSSKLDKKSDLKEDSENEKEECESVNKKSTSLNTENSQAEILGDQRGISNKKFLPPVKHRFHVVDSKTQMLFLIGTESELSVFPQEFVKRTEIEPFDGSFEVTGTFGKKEEVFGWTTLVIDIGVGREFSWKFALINIGKPILGWDFISHFGFAFHVGGLLDLETKITAPPPQGPCDCGQVNDGWPTFVNFMIVPRNEFTGPNESSLDIEEESRLVKKESAKTDDSLLVLSSKNSTISNQARSKKKSKLREEDSKLKEQKKESARTSIEKKPKQEIKSLKEDPSTESKTKKKKSARDRELSLSIEEKPKQETKSLKQDPSPETKAKKKRSARNKELSSSIEEKPKQETKSLKLDPSPETKAKKKRSAKNKELSSSIEEKPKQETKLLKQDPSPESKAKKRRSAGTSKELSTLKEENLENETKSSSENLYHQSEEKILGISNDLSKMEHKSLIKHRFHITDKNSNLSFYVDTESEISVFPKAKMGGEPLEECQESYEIIDSEGSNIPVQGWTTRTMDFGIGEQFFWRFAVIDTAKPILNLNFLAKFNLGVNKKKQIIYNKYGRCTKFPSEPCDCQELSSTILTSLKIKRMPHEIKHRFHFMDKNSKMLFFVCQMTQISLFPRTKIHKRSMEVSKNSEIIDCVRMVLPIYGWVTLKVDFGLERQFEWKFAVVDTLRPIIGLDFLKNFGLTCVYTMEYPRLLDPRSNLETSEFTGSCNCGNSFDFPVLTALRISDSDSEEFPVQKKLENNITRCSDVRCPHEERMILVERETGMPYLLSGATISVFPESEANKEEIEPFDDSFDLVQLNGSVIPVHGWITRKLDFGLGRYFVWKFAVINIGRPLLANDFLHHYNFAVSYKGRSVFDEVTSKTVVGSTDFCECQARHFWPDISSMGIKFKSNRVFPDKIQRGSTEDSTSSEEDDDSKKDSFRPDPVEA